MRFLLNFYSNSQSLPEPRNWHPIKKRKENWSPLGHTVISSIHKIRIYRLLIKIHDDNYINLREEKRKNRDFKETKPLNRVRINELSLMNLF